MPKKTWAEYKREQRKRERERRLTERDAAVPDLRTPFFEYFEKHGGIDLNWYASVMGAEWFNFEDDSGIKPDNVDALAREDVENAATSLAKAELLIGLFINAATDLASVVSAYKRSEIEARLLEAQRSSPVNRDEVIRLKNLRYRLNRQVRWAFPQWRASGD
ncbi:hypothetical protein [Rhizobium paknamense]|uniref:Tail assembly chaperone n=1 Tax=Rhizobium paknamense TaxID=1206817 RepID=A0ABU0IAA8_9HYPH|nr:hypothetical protein [Rhizobium paknamense]MDQ0455158.1 hypothetical protein [Rhizobium paknamense]